MRLDCLDYQYEGSRYPLRLRVAAGFLAATLMTLVMFFLRFLTGVPTLPELVADRAIPLIPPSLFASTIGLLGSYAKPMFFAALFALQLAIMALLGIAYAYFGQKTRREEKSHAEVKSGEFPIDLKFWASGIAFSFIPWLITMTLLLPLVEAGPFGASLRAGPTLVSTSMLVIFFIYGFSLALFHAKLTEATVGLRTAKPEALDTGRRGLLLKLGAGVLVLVGGGVAFKLIADLAKSNRSLASSKDVVSLPLEITPNQDFYTVSKNLIDPVVNLNQWKLEISGLVKKPLQLSLPELKSLPSREQFVTLECISNPVGGDLIGNAQWRGIPLRDLLQRAGIKPTAKKVVFQAWDEYSDSIPLAKALDEATWVVYEMNGEPLADNHGFPARVIVPGIYGMKNVKWLTAIKLVDYDYRGFWQKEEGWSDTAEILTMSRIDVPTSRSSLASDKVSIRGIAFAGDRSIARVEVSTDDGVTWEEATLKKPLSPYTWVLWEKEWRPRRMGNYSLQARVTDGAGKPQIATIYEPFPNGATGYHSIKVKVI